jgi:hypothetical protein
VSSAEGEHHAEVIPGIVNGGGGEGGHCIGVSLVSHVKEQTTNGAVHDKGSEAAGGPGEGDAAS